MAAEYIPVEIGNAPDLQRLAEAVQKTGIPHALKRGAETVAVVHPAPKKEAGARSPRRRRTGVLRADDPLFQIAGIGASGGPGDISSNKHQHLADAYAAEAE